MSFSGRRASLLPTGCDGVLSMWMPFGAPDVFAAPVCYRVSSHHHAADVANGAIAREGAAALALAFRGSLAPVRKLVLESVSAADLEQRIRAFYADWSPARVAPLIEEALAAFAANGAAVNVRAE